MLSYAAYYIDIPAQYNRKTDLQRTYSSSMRSFLNCYHEALLCLVGLTMILNIGFFELDNDLGNIFGFLFLNVIVINFMHTNYSAYKDIQKHLGKNEDCSEYLLD
jgi:hypothetical protein